MLGILTDQVLKLLNSYLNRLSLYKWLSGHPTSFNPLELTSKLSLLGSSKVQLCTVFVTNHLLCQ